MSAFMRLLHSFQLRITVLSTCLSGVVLFAFGLWGWGVANRMSQDRLDATVREMATPHLTFPRPNRYWNEMADSLAFLLGNDKGDGFILLVKGPDETPLYQSDNWPADLSAAELPPPLAGGPPDGGPGPLEEGGPPQFEGPHPPQGGQGPPGFPPPPPPEAGPPGMGRPLRQNTGARNGLSLLEEDMFSQNPMRDGRGRFGPPPDRDGMPGMRPGGGRGRGGPPPPMHVEVRQFMTLHTPEATWRVCVASNPEVTMALGLDMAPVQAQTRGLRNTYLFAAPVALLFIAAGGWMVSRRALRPVNTLTLAAERITAKGLDQRIPYEHADAEFETLIQVFNNMMERLDRSFQQATRFSADAAHELKTPLTILQGHLEQALANAGPGSKQQQTYNLLLEEVQRLKSIIRKLLLLSLADAGQLKINPQPVRMSEIAEGVCEDLEVIAPKLKLQQSIAPGIVVMGDADLLKQVVQNLMTNAVKYNRKEGKVVVRLDVQKGMAVLSIANTGAGIAESDRSRIFDRFYRGDKARSRKGGAGLGLSLGREIARAHGGDLVLAEANDDRTVFQLALPTQS